MDNKCPYIATDQTAVIIFSVLYAGNCAGKVEPRSKVPLAHQKVKKKYIFFHVQICLVMLLIVGLFAWVIIQLVNNLKH